MVKSTRFTVTAKIGSPRNSAIDHRPGFVFNLTDDDLAIVRLFAVTRPEELVKDAGRVMEIGMSILRLANAAIEQGKADEAA